MARAKSRSARMQMLESLTDNEVKILATQMGHHAAQLRDSEAQLSDLETYLDGCEIAPVGQGQASVSALQLVEKHAFLQRLRQAVAAQQTVVLDARTRYEAVRAQWLAKHLRGTALGKAVQRFQKEETQEVERREQRLQDETASRILQPR